MREIWPNFFVVGAAKAGTTSIYAHLSRHPAVFFPSLKEPHFFAQFRPSKEKRFYFRGITRRSDYLRLFDNAHGYDAVGDASTSYLWHPEVPRRISVTVPHAKIVIILRDPVDRAYSHYLMDYREGVQHLPFIEALREDLNRSEKGFGVSYLYYELGLYAEQIRRYLEVFKPERTKILLFDDFKRDPKAVLQSLAEFLELDARPFDHIDTSVPHNVYAAPRYEWMRRLAGARASRMLGESVVPDRVGRFIFCRLFLKRAPKPPIDPRARDLLASLYDSDLNALENMIGWRLPNLRRSSC